MTCNDDVFLDPSMVFTKVINPRSAINRRVQYLKTFVGKGALLVRIQPLFVDTILVGTHLLVPAL